jgi:hypothetical protein
MDRVLRQQIVAEFRQQMTGLNERYVTAETLCQHIEVLTPEWLKRNGSCFNRTRAEWVDADGNHHSTSWVYPLHEIMLMVKDGRIKELICKKTTKQ